MENIDTLFIIINKRSIRDNIFNNFVNKQFYNLCCNVVIRQISIKRCFDIFKKLIVKRIKTYYTIKNKYFNRENLPILIF